MAEVLGVTVSTASKIERGERRLDPVELWRLAKLYGKPVSAFLPK